MLRGLRCSHHVAASRPTRRLAQRIFVHGSNFCRQDWPTINRRSIAQTSCIDRHQPPNSRLYKLEITISRSTRYVRVILAGEASTYSYEVRSTGVYGPRPVFRETRPSTLLPGLAKKHRMHYCSLLRIVLWVASHRSRCPLKLFGEKSANHAMM